MVFEALRGRRIAKLKLHTDSHVNNAQFGLSIVKERERERVRERQRERAGGPVLVIRLPEIPRGPVPHRTTEPLK